MTSVPSASARAGVLRCRGGLFGRPRPPPHAANPPPRPAGAGRSLGLPCGPQPETPAPRRGGGRSWGPAAAAAAGAARWRRGPGGCGVRVGGSRGPLRWRVSEKRGPAAQTAEGHGRRAQRPPSGSGSEPPRPAPTAVGLAAEPGRGSPHPGWGVLAGVHKGLLCAPKPPGRPEPTGDGSAHRAGPGSPVLHVSLLLPLAHRRTGGGFLSWPGWVRFRKGCLSWTALVSAALRGEPDPRPGPACPPNRPAAGDGGPERSEPAGEAPPARSGAPDVPQKQCPDPDQGCASGTRESSSPALGQTGRHPSRPGEARGEVLDAAAQDGSTAVGKGAY